MKVLRIPCFILLLLLVFSLCNSTAVSSRCHDWATQIDAIEMLESIIHMHGAVYIDAQATASVERDITCQERFPRECACIDGYCGWRLNADYNACLYE